MIRTGDVYTFTAQGDVRIGLLPVSVQDLHAAVVRELSSYFAVQSVVINPVGSVFVGMLDWSYSATVIVQLRSDYGALADVASIVAHAFAESTGDTPTVAAGVLPSIDDGDNAVPWSNAIVFVAIALGLLAIFGLKKL